MKPSKPVHVRSHWRSGALVQEYFRSLPNSSYKESDSSGCISSLLWFAGRMVMWSLALGFVLIWAMLYFFYELLIWAFTRAKSNPTVLISSDADKNSGIPLELINSRTENLEQINRPGITRIWMNWILANSVIWILFYIIIHFAIEFSTELEMITLAIGGAGIIMGILQAIVLSRGIINPIAWIVATATGLYLSMIVGLYTVVLTPFF